MALVKRSFSLAGHRTSVALEAAFWAEIDRLAEARGLPLARLVAQIDAGRLADGTGLASALRLAALAHVQAERDRARSAADDPPGHLRAP